jgi:hypothetical protein
MDTEFIAFQHPLYSPRSYTTELAFNFNLISQSYELLQYRVGALFVPLHQRD